MLEEIGYILSKTVGALIGTYILPILLIVIGYFAKSLKQAIIGGIVIAILFGIAGFFLGTFESIISSSSGRIEFVISVYLIALVLVSVMISGVTYKAKKLIGK